MVYICPACSSKFQSESVGAVICPTCGRLVFAGEQGCEWDRAEAIGWTNAFFATVKRALFAPVEFFQSVAGSSKWGRSIVFASIIYFLVVLVGISFNVGFAMLAGVFEGASAPEKLGMVAFSIPITIITALIGGVFFSIMIFVMSIVAAGIYHLCLMLLGAAQKPFTDTLRVVWYSAAPQVFVVLPFFGGAIAGIWQIILYIIGFKVVHGTSYGRAALAVFLPTIVCCSALFLIALTVAGSFVAALLNQAVGH